MNGQLSLGLYGIKDIPFGRNPGIIHDHNLSVFEEGRLVSHLHLERVSKNKFDAGIEYQLEEIVRQLKLVHPEHLSICSVDHELGKAFISDKGQIRFEASRASGSIEGLHPAECWWFGRRIPAFSMSHELAHLYSCLPFYGMFRENSLLVHYDGGASISNFSAWSFRKGKLKLLSAHNRLRKITNLFNANALVFRLTGTPPMQHHSVPGKLMGLASYGSYSSGVEEWLRMHEYFAGEWKSPRKFLDAVTADWGPGIKDIDNRNKFMQDIAATIHTVFIRESLQEIVSHIDSQGFKQLYFTGGCALSIKLNSALLNTGHFDDVLIPPCTNDSGLSLGAGAALAMEQGFTIEPTSPYLNNFGITRCESNSSGESLDRLAHLLEHGAIVAIYQGFGECGPRALGNRSILCRADSPVLARRLSMECKGREWYRPVAPVMLEKNARLFTGISQFPAASAYMLFDFAVLEEHRRELNGVVHTDGSARIQVLPERKAHPLLYDLLSLLESRYGRRALVNTSFNVKGKPMVHTEEDAMVSARKMHLDALLLNGMLHEF